MDIEGVGRDAAVVENAEGGKQSKVLYRFDLFDPAALFAVSGVLAEGAEKYGEWNWLKIPSQDHINHAIIHLYAHLAGDKSDDHLSHAMCRVMFALRKQNDEELSRLLRSDSETGEG